MNFSIAQLCLRDDAWHLLRNARGRDLAIDTVEKSENSQGQKHKLEQYLIKYIFINHYILDLHFILSAWLHTIWPFIVFTIVKEHYIYIILMEFKDLER